MKASPMTGTEVDEYLERISAHPHSPGGQHDMQELREFFSADDGEAFYTVNLYKFHDKAKYLSNDHEQISGHEAYDKFSSVMIKLLLKNASYPIFGSTWLGLSDKGWDRMAIVRYSSRRNMAEIFSDPEFSIASAHKWASIEKHDRFVVKALHLPEMYMLLALFIAIFLTFLLTNKTLDSRKPTI
jgi:hypothetical protein